MAIPTLIPRPKSIRRGRGRGARPAGFNGSIPPIRGLLPIVALLAFWQIFGDPDSLSYPPPSAWLNQLVAFNDDGLLLPAVLSTLRTFVLGLVCGTIIGTLLGALVGSSRRADQAISPVTDFFRALPPPAVISIILLILGLKYTTVLVMVTLGTMWPILLNTAAGMRSMPSVRLDMSMTMGLSPLDRLVKITLPSLLPTVMLGVKISAAIAFVITLFIEILGITDGVGYFLNARQSRYDSAGVWGLLLVIGVCGYLINVCLALIERRILRGRPTAGS